VSVASDIESKVAEAFQPAYLELINESHMHAGPATDTHFKLVLASSRFEGLNAVKRHQLVYRVVADELAGPVHALALHLYSPEEWERAQAVPSSPQCAGKKTIKNK